MSFAIPIQPQNYLPQRDGENFTGKRTSTIICRQDFTAITRAYDCAG